MALKGVLLTAPPAAPPGSGPPEKIGPCFEFSLWMSRACLGKKIIFSNDKSGKRYRFCPPRRALQQQPL
eukprot:COSAG06_NODE_54629_length_293_cov_1.319588_1_plen_68_part_10